MKVILTFFFCLSLLCSYSQDWTSFTNHKESRDIAKEGDVLWVATGGGLIQWDLTNNSYTKWTTSDGLISNNIRAIAIDIEGNKWLATAHGISKIDPAGTVSNFTKKDGLHSNEISAVATSPNGEIWFGTNEQYSDMVAIRMDLDGVFHNETIVSTGSPPGIYNLIIDKQNHVYVNHYSIIYKRDQAGDWSTFVEQITDPPHGTFEALSFDETGNLWGIAGQGIFSYDLDGTQTVYDESNEIIGYPFSLFIDSESTKWVGTKDGVFALKNNLETSFVEMETAVTALVGKPEEMHFGSSYELFSFNPANSNLTLMKTHDELLGNQVNGLDLADDGSVWLATSQGVAHYTENYDWINYDKSDGLQCNDTHKIVVGANNQVFTGHFLACQGISIIDTETDELTSIVFDSLSYSFGMDTDNDNTLWVGNYQGGITGQKSLLNLLPDGSYKYYDFADAGVNPAPNDKSTGMNFDSDGNRYFSARSGIYKMDANYNLQTFNPSSAFNSGTAIFIDSEENVWLGKGDYFTGTYGLLKSNSNGEVISISHPELDDHFIYEITEDIDGNIWVASENGLFLVDENEVVIRYSTADGLADNHITGIQISSEGDIWLSTINGVSTTKKIVSSTNSISSTAQALSVYPNPSYGQFTILLPKGMNTQSTITVFNQLGQAIKQQVIRKNDDNLKLDLTTFPEGMYFINLAVQSDIFTAKILKLE